MSWLCLRQTTSLSSNHGQEYNLLLQAYYFLQCSRHPYSIRLSGLIASGSKQHQQLRHKQGLSMGSTGGQVLAKATPAAPQLYPLNSWTWGSSSLSLWQVPSALVMSDGKLH